MLEVFIAISCFLNVDSPTEKIGYVRENVIKVDLKEIGWEGMDWIHLAEANGWL
jgi:hypothetical protein